MDYQFLLRINDEDADWYSGFGSVVEQNIDIPWGSEYV